MDYVMADDHAYIVKDENVGKAIEFLKVWVEHGEPKAVALGDGRSLIARPRAPFDGEIPSGWGEAVEKFLGDYCEDGSHAVFRDDDEFEWRFYWKEDGEVRAESESICNPFWMRQREMDGENGVADNMARLMEAGVF